MSKIIVLKSQFLLSIFAMILISSGGCIISKDSEVPSSPIGTPSEPVTTEAPNKYLEDVVLPSCDTSNPEVQIISSTADFWKTNDLTKKIFCIKPGDYTGTTLDISRSGVSNDDRVYLILDNGNDIHPGVLYRMGRSSELANIKIILRGASYWTIDRMAFFDMPGKYENFLELKQPDDKSRNQEYNIINRVFMHNVGGGVTYYNASNHNTIQNSRFEEMSEEGRAYDGVCVKMRDFRDADSALPYYSAFTISQNNKFIKNEFKNCSDAFQFVRTSLTSNDLDFSGTIFDSNDAYITNALYTDCSGNYDVNGDCAHAENAIDIKSASLSAANPVIISNNRFWGYRKSDTTTPLSGYDNYINDPGTAVAIHYGVEFVLFYNNLIFDSTRAIQISDTGAGMGMTFDFAAGNSTFYNNIILNSAPLTTAPDAIIISTGKNLSFFDNYIENINGRWVSGDAISTEINLECNTIINTTVSYTLHSTSARFFNTYYNTVDHYDPINNPTYPIGAGNYEAAEEGEFYLQPISFITDRFTNAPYSIDLNYHKSLYPMDYCLR